MFREQCSDIKRVRTNVSLKDIHMSVSLLGTALNGEPENIKILLRFTCTAEQPLCRPTLNLDIALNECI